MKITAIIIVAILVSIFLVYILFNNFAPQLGNKGTKDIPERIKNSPQFKGGEFINLVETSVSFDKGNLWPMLKDFIWGKEVRKPLNPINNIPLSKSSFEKLPFGKTAITWLGHSSFILQTQGCVFMVDPVFSKRASVFSFMGPKQFPFAFPYEVKEVPALDAILITHDHYDHLDYKTIRELHGRTKQFYVPLGVKAHLIQWGVEDSKITEMDWWEEVNYNDSINLVATPTRHFTGRRANNRFSTLWCSWVVQTGTQRVFFGGDSGMHPAYKEISNKYGPFDITLLECGAYSKYWRDIHSFPAETAAAHLALRGKVLMPVHWGKFDLSIHGWTEPIESLVKIAEEKDIQIVTPRIGERVVLNEAYPTDPWWRDN